MLGTIKTILVLFSLPFFRLQELEDESRVISVALVDDKFEVLSGGKYVNMLMLVWWWLVVVVVMVVLMLVVVVLMLVWWWWVLKGAYLIIL